MEYRVKSDQLFAFRDQVEKQYKIWNQAIISLYQRISTLKSSNNMSGSGADAIRSYLESVHVTILGLLLKLTELHFSNCALYVDDYQQNIDSALHAVINASELNYVRSAIEHQEQACAGLDEQVKDTLHQISDIFSVDYRSALDVIASHKVVSQFAADLDEKICGLEARHLSTDFQNTSELIARLKTFITEQTNKDREFKTTFDNAALTSSPAFMALSQAHIGVDEEIHGKRDAVREAAERKEKRDEALQEEEYNRGVFGTNILAGNKCVSWIRRNKEAIEGYGKATLKAGKALVKIVGAVGAFATGVGIPVAIVSIVSAGNDIINAAQDATYTYLGEYDKIGTADYLKDKLVASGGKIGSFFGNEEAGELAGKIIYTGVDVVTFLDGTDKMLKSLGKVNTVVTRTTGHSIVWGHTKFKDVFDNKIKFSLDPDYFVRKLLDVDPSSEGNIVYEGAKNVYKTLKSAWKLGGKISELT